MRIPLFATTILGSLLITACAHMPSQPEATRWVNAQQMVVVTPENWESTDATLQRFERRNGVWEQVGDTITVMLGRTGSAWGMGLNNARTDGPVKKEGDGKSPAGVFTLGTAFGYANTVSTGLPYQAMSANDWCIDVPASNYYNQIIDRSVVKAPYLEQSSEPMRRDLHADGDQRYREGFIIEHNADGKARQGGSCIFAHLWKAPGETTAGCTAMAPESMDALLAWLDKRQHPVFVLLPQAQYASLEQQWNLPETTP